MLKTNAEVRAAMEASLHTAENNVTCLLETVEDARLALEDAKEQLAEAQANVARLAVEVPLKIRLSELEEEADTVRKQLAALDAPVQPKQAAQTAAIPVMQAVEAPYYQTETGQRGGLTAEQTERVKAILGRKLKGTLSADDGEALVNVMDEAAAEPFDSFTLHLPGRKTHLIFSVEEEGLTYRTERN